MNLNIRNDARNNQVAQKLLHFLKIIDKNRS
jgi:hypothetical protein